MDEGPCTNQAESYFSRLRRMEIGTHHHIAGPYLNACAGEAAGREDTAAVREGIRRRWCRRHDGSGAVADVGGVLAGAA